MLQARKPRKNLWRIGIGHSIQNPVARAILGWREPREVTFLGVPFLWLEARNSRKYGAFDSSERERFDASSMRRQDAGDQNTWLVRRRGAKKAIHGDDGEVTCVD